MTAFRPISDPVAKVMAASLQAMIEAEPDAAEAVFGFTAERRQKPTIDPETGEWTTRATIIVKDASGRIVAEKFELGEETCP